MTRRVLVAITAFVAAAGLGWLAYSSVQKDDASDSGAVESGTDTVTVPVLEPVGVGDEPALGADGRPIPSRVVGTAEVSVDDAAVGAAATDGPAGGPPTAVSGTGAPAASTTAGPSFPDRLAAVGPDEPSATAGRVPRRVDPCVADGAATCPDGGVSGTILAITSPSPLWIVGAADPPSGFAGGSLLDCPQAPVEPDDGVVDQPFGVVTSTPVAGMTVRFWPAGQPDRAQQVALATDPDATARWGRTLDEGEGFERTDWLQHCFLIDDLPVGQLYDFQIDALDILDRHETATGGFRVRDDRDHPPTLLFSSGLDQLWVATSASTSQLTYAVALRHAAGDSVFAEPGPDGAPNPCAAYELAPDRVPDGYDRVVEGITRSVVDRSEPYPADYPWNGRDRRGISSSLQLEEGTAYTICVYWVREDAPSFDAGVSERIERAEVTTPNRARPVIAAAWLYLDEPLAENAVHVELGACGEWWSGPARETGLTELEPAEVLCDFRDDGSTLDRARGGLLHLTTHEDGRRHDRWTQLPLDLEPCASPCAHDGPERWITLLPGPAGAGGLCGYDAIFSSGCEPRRRPRGPGSLGFEIEYVDGPAGGTEWAISPVEPAELPARTPAELPQLDTSQRPVVVGDPLHPSVEVPIRADRPVRARARTALLPGSSSSVCLRGGSTGEASADGFGLTHTLTITGLCPATMYSIAVELTDQDGNTAVYQLTDNRLSPFFYDGLAVTEPYSTPVSVVATVGPYPDNDGAEIVHAAVGIGYGGVSWPENRGDCLYRSYLLERTTTVDLGGQVPIHVDFSAGDAVGGCVEGGSFDGGSVTFDRVVSIDELLAGPVHFQSSDTDPFPVEVTVTARPG